MISVGGSFLLIIGIVGYLGGFLTLRTFITETYNERKNKNLEEKMLRKNSQDDGADGIGGAQGRYER